MSDALLQRWRAVAGERADDLGRRLIAAYGEPHRHYHGLGHVVWLLDESERRSDLIRDHAMIGYALWFHDAIYLPGAPDNEQLSADWAEHALADDADLARRVGKLVRQTKRHAEGDADEDEALFLDMDVAILGAPWEAYCAYAAGVRAEFAHIVDPAFAAGRAAFLQGQLDLVRLFRTNLYESELGAAARANMGWELEEMRKGRMVKG